MSASTTVRGLDGETFTLRHAPGASLAEIKQLIAERTGIDPAQQHVSRGGRTVVDEGDAAQRCTSESQRRAEDQLAASLEQRLCRASTGAVATGRRGVLPSCSRPRPCGLKNIGGTSCYLNAALQALLAVDQLALPDFYTRFLQTSSAGAAGRRWRLARAIAAFVTGVSTAADAAGTAEDEDATREISHAPEYLHALLSNGVTGLGGAERFCNGAPADCGECWDLFMRALDDSDQERSALGGGLAVSSRGGVGQLFSGAWSCSAEIEDQHSERETESVFWSLTLLRAGSIYRCFTANGIQPLAGPTHVSGSPIKRPKTDPLGCQSPRSASTDTATKNAEAGCDACRHIKRLPEYLVLQFKSDPAKRRQRPVVFPIEGLDLSGYVLQSVPWTHSAEKHSRQVHAQAEAASEVYDLVAVVYYHSSHGPMHAIDGQPLSGSMQHQSSRQHQYSQAGHYTAAVFRPGQSPHCMPHADADDLASSRKKREFEQERNGTWWVCDDEQVRLLSDPKRLVANEAQILMYHRRSQHLGRNVALGPAQCKTWRPASRGTSTDSQGPQLTRTRVKFGEDGSVVRTVREPAVVDGRSAR